MIRPNHCVPSWSMTQCMSKIYPHQLSWKVVKVLGPLSYYVVLQSGWIVCRQVDAVHKRVASHLPLVTYSPSALDGKGATDTPRHSGNSTCSNSALADSECPTTVWSILFVDLLIIAHHLINVVTVSEGGSVVKAKELQRHINCNTSCHFH